jgi:hypothetical protein
VTLSVDQVTFREPIHIGELVSFLASVNYTGTMSMEVGIKVVTEAMDEPRRPVAVPPLEPTGRDAQAPPRRRAHAARAAAGVRAAPACDEVRRRTGLKKSSSRCIQPRTRGVWGLQTPRAGARQRPGNPTARHPAGGRPMTSSKG